MGDCCCNEVPRDISQITPAYRRALWIVIILNVLYGIVESIGGFISRSQALKADALDFLGDGFITWIAILALSWRGGWRARAALAQGLFLGALGIGVLALTIYRIFVAKQPEAYVMGVFGGIALAVNVIATAVLIPHRKGNVNVRAIWLFSRNDAIGNLAVVFAGGLVAWTHSAWPDLIVAFGIATLFLYSSWIIVKESIKELR